MHFNKAMVSIGACVLGMLAVSSGFAGETIEVVKAEGSVEVKQQDRQGTSAVHSKSVLPAKNILSTGPNGRAVVRVGDAGVVILEKNSTIEITKTSDHAGIFRQITGIIYYAMNTIRGSQKPAEVRTATATIGVRGTRFLVSDVEDRKEIGMRKGVVSVTSPGDAYEIHRKMQEDEFEAFKKEGRDAIAEEKRKFSEYKANNEREFIEYKREFALGADRMATFDGKRVNEGALSGESKKDIETLESYGAEWVNEVHD